MQPVWENLKRSIICSQEMIHFLSEKKRINTIVWITKLYNFKEKGTNWLHFFSLFCPFTSLIKVASRNLNNSSYIKKKMLENTKQFSIIRWQTNVSKARFSQQQHQQRTLVSVRSKHKMKRQRDSAAYFFLRWPENCLCPTQKEKDQ